MFLYKCFFFHHLMGCLLISVGAMEMVFVYGGARFLGCVMTCYFIFCCFLMECRCYWKIGWSLAIKVWDKWNNLPQAMYFSLVFFL